MLEKCSLDDEAMHTYVLSAAISIVPVSPPHADIAAQYASHDSYVVARLEGRLTDGELTLATNSAAEQVSRPL